MSSLGSPSPFLIGGKKAYEIERSLRFNDNDSAYLARTPSSAGNRKVWTWSAWVKRGNLGLNTATLFHAYDGSSSNRAVFNFQSDDTLNIDQGGGSGSAKGQAESTMVFRDVGAWYHILIRANYSDSTASDRIKLYVNGTQQTLTFDVNYTDEDGQINGTFEHQIGQHGGGSYFDGYIAEINFVDGTALDASSFGETDATTGQWNPKKYTGSYGTNGFYLNFSDNSGTTATTLGKDSSGNGNNFTPNNLAVSDSMLDTPTNNFATMNPLNGYTGLSQGNLRFNTYNDSSGPRSVQATIALPKSGKWYWEARYQESGTGTITTKYFALSQIQNTNGYLTAPYVYYGRTNIKNGNNSEDITNAQDWYNGTGVPAIVSMAIDVDNNSVKFYHNNTLQGTITLPTLTSSQEYFFTWTNTSGGSSSSLNDTFNFGADSTFQGQVSSGGNTDANGIGDFKYAPPSGHLALCTANLPNPTIKLPNKHFGTLLYSAGSSNGTFTFTDSDAVDFFPDWTWLKCRSSAEDHYLFDALRGNVDITDKFLKSNGTDTETGAGVDGTTVSSIQNGLKIVETSIGSGEIYFTNRNYVTWNWNAGGSTVTNNDGSITSSVRANTSAGFSIIAFEGTGSLGTVGHGLGVKPDVMIFKNRDEAHGWNTYHSSLGATKNLQLNTNAAVATASNKFNDTEPTSTVMTVNTAADTNQNGMSMICYCFSEVAGYSKFGSYSANGDSNGPFVFTGFRPAWILIKNTDLNQPWVLMDNKINPHNLADTRLSPNSNDAEYTNANNYIDFLSNGFKVRSPGTSDINYSTSYPTHIYLAFAESPFKNARAR